jgi:ethanolamine transporter EutH
VEKREIMKAGTAAKKVAYIGGGAGLVLFAIIGLLPSSFVGGIIGIKIAGELFGLPLTSNLLPRLIVALFMLLSVLISGIVFVATGMTTGWTIWKVIESLKISKPVSVRAYFTGRRKAKKAKADNAGQQDSEQKH